MTLGLGGLALIVASLAAAQPVARNRSGVIHGTVADTALRPIVGADVNFAGSSVRVSTDSLGRFRVVNVPAGKFILIVRNIGFRPATSEIEIGANDTLRLAFELEPTVRELSAIVVTEKNVSPRLRDFESRRRAGFGEFFNMEDIEKAIPITVGDVLRRSKTVRVISDGLTEKALSSREWCPMAIYLDNVPLGPIDLSYLPSPKEIAAIEVYAGAATLPIWLTRGPNNSKPGCGAILVWTRDGS
jgi:hypothetical protein